jgi:hypothetical protein
MRAGADQLRCSGSSIAARPRATSRRGSRSGIQIGFPREEAGWVKRILAKVPVDSPQYCRHSS